MGTFAFAAATLDFTDGRKKTEEKNLGSSEERSWPEVNLLALFGWLLRHRRKLTEFLRQIS